MKERIMKEVFISLIRYLTMQRNFDISTGYKD